MRKFLIFFLCLFFAFPAQCLAKNISPLILTIRNYPLTREERAYIKKVNPYGFIFVTKDFKKNINFPALKNQLTKLLKHKVYFFVDQEGGPVNRLRYMYPKKKFPSAEYYGDIAHTYGIKKAEALVYRNARRMARLLANISMDVNLAPNAEVRPPNYKGFFDKRIFSEEAQVSRRLSQAFADGTLAGGVEPCFKHFPGTALSAEDPHKGVSVIDGVSLKDLIQKEFVPFTPIQNYNCVMVGHALYPQVDAEHISTFSPTFYNILRNDFGFEGLIITDALNMKASGDESIGEKIAMSLSAGADLAMPFFDYDMPFEERLKEIEKIPPQIIKSFNQKISKRKQ